MLEVAYDWRSLHGMSFLDKKHYSLLRIESGIDADLYKLSKKSKKLVNKLLKRNGLFLVKY